MYFAGAVALLLAVILERAIYRHSLSDFEKWPCLDRDSPRPYFPRTTKPPTTTHAHSPIPYPCQNSCTYRGLPCRHDHRGTLVTQHGCQAVVRDWVLQPMHKALGAHHEVGIQEPNDLETPGVGWLGFFSAWVGVLLAVGWGSSFVRFACVQAHKGRRGGCMNERVLCVCVQVCRCPNPASPPK